MYVFFLQARITFRHSTSPSTFVLRRCSCYSLSMDDGFCKTFEHVVTFTKRWHWRGSVQDFSMSFSVTTIQLINGWVTWHWSSQVDLFIRRLERFEKSAATFWIISLHLTLPAFHMNGCSCCQSGEVLIPLWTFQGNFPFRTRWSWHESFQLDFTGPRMNQFWHQGCVQRPWSCQVGISFPDLHIHAFKRSRGFLSSAKVLWWLYCLRFSYF